SHASRDRVVAGQVRDGCGHSSNPGLETEREVLELVVQAFLASDRSADSRNAAGAYFDPHRPSAAWHRLVETYNGWAISRRVTSSPDSMPTTRLCRTSGKKSRRRDEHHDHRGDSEEPHEMSISP